MKLSNIPDEIEELCYNKEWFVGESRRIKHLYNTDGSECSVQKSAALSIIRKPDGWWYHCFRCGLSGFKEDRSMSVGQVEKELKALQIQKQYDSVAEITLPTDFLQVQDDPVLNKKIPKMVYSWLWESSVCDEMFKIYNIGWSKIYQRCIIPVYEYSGESVKDNFEKELVGWIGRDCRDLTKEERTKEKVSKYIIRKHEKYERIYFHAPAKSDVYVLVEDALSAIRISAACGVNAYALLTTSIPTNLLLRLKNKKVILWLDEDQLANMINVVSKGSNLGLDIDYIHTNRDPKAYNPFAIQHKINEKR